MKVGKCPVKYPQEGNGNHQHKAQQQYKGQNTEQADTESQNLLSLVCCSHPM